MKLHFLAVSCFSFISIFGDISPLLKGPLQYIPASQNGIDAVFIVNNTRSMSRCNSMKAQLENAGVKAIYNEIYHGHNLPEQALLRYCSKYISPELLAQILNHLSIYQFALEENLSTVAIIESTSTLRGKWEYIKQAAAELKSVDPEWDVLYLNTDYCYEKERGKAKYISPQVIENGRKKPNSAHVSPLLSRVFCRYGYSSYVISYQGMRKMIDFFKNGWPNLPLDQVIFHVPYPKLYSVNKDIFFDRVFQKKRSEKITTFFKRKEYPLNKEFWIDPKKLVTTSRLDIVAKYLYAKSLLEGQEIDRNKKYYLEHIKGWNNYYEGAPLKIGSHAFLNSFHKLIRNMKEQGFCSSADPVPINSVGEIQNGAHRVAACLALNIPIKVKVVRKSSSLSTRGCFATQMRESYQLSEEAISHFVSGYIQLKKPYIYLLKCSSNSKQLQKFISKFVDVVDQKEDTYIVESKKRRLISQLVEKWNTTREETLSASHL